MTAVEIAAVVGMVILAIWAAASTINAFRPFRNVVVLLPSMLWSWWVIGLPLQHIVVGAIVAGILIWLGALSSPIGWVALAVLVLSWVGLVVLRLQTRGAGRVVDEALAKAGIPRTTNTVAAWRQLVAFPFRGRSVKKLGGIEFRRVAGRTLKLDIYTDGSDTTGRPVLLYVHGGGWVVGDKREQGIPLLHHAARSGWVGVTVNYRLSPGAGWPDHLCDVKAGLAWVREHIDDYGGDPSFVAVAGGSAGGQLAAMMGLTENQPQYQPGFEDADTSVQVTVPIYGIYDMTNRMGLQSPQFVPRLMEPLVIKAFIDDEPEKFSDASAMDRIHPDAPPFVVSQGDKDTLAPVEEARAFVDDLEGTSKERVVYFEFPGAQHIFDLGYSHQSSQMIEGVLSVLEDEVARRAQAPDPGDRSSEG